MVLVFDPVRQENKKNMNKNLVRFDENYIILSSLKQVQARLRIKVFTNENLMKSNSSAHFDKRVLTSS